MVRRAFWWLSSVALGLLVASSPARATTYTGDPTTYKTLIASLAPGDTLRLVAGNYVRMTLDGVVGTASAWIVIEGPSSGAPAVIQGQACCNTVQFYGSSYVVLRRFTIDGRNNDVDGINAKDVPSHHIVIEDCTFVNFGATQQTVGISTKVEVWNWVVRRNRIEGAGTGIYFGNSDGSAPFIAGIIEGNWIKNTIGYNMEIKHQNNYTATGGMPTGPSRTIIRDNVFIKDDRSSPDGDRPNLLVDGFPDAGTGSSDLYEIYGNLLVHNARESLLQASGRVSIHDNVFVDAGANQAAIYLTDHDHILRLAHVYNNTIYGGQYGIQVASPPREEGRIVGNLVFASTAISVCGSCSMAANTGNATSSVANAGSYVTQPSVVLGSMDFYPLTSCVPCAGSALDLSAFATQTDYDRDFNRDPKGGFTYRGAYAGAGTNPGWRLSDGFKTTDSGGPGGDAIAPAAISDLTPR